MKAPGPCSAAVNRPCRGAFTGTCLLLATWLAAVPAASQSHAAAPRDSASARAERVPAAAGASDRVPRPAPSWSAAVPIPPALRPPESAATAPPLRSMAARPFGRYTTWGMVIGGAVGLAYGVAQGDDAFGLSPVIETAIGIGIGFYAGAAVDLVRGRF